jgi:iron complex transport system ATP-binding protein
VASSSGSCWHGRWRSPPILLLDEPTSHLDLHHQVGLLELVHALVREDRLAVLITLHDLNLAARYADRVALLVDGRVTAQGTPDQVLQAGLISQAYHLPVSVIPNPLDGSPLVLPRSPLPPGEAGS